MSRIQPMEFIVNGLKRASHHSKITNLRPEDVARDMNVAPSTFVSWKIRGKIFDQKKRLEFQKLYGFDFNA